MSIPEKASIASTPSAKDVLQALTHALNTGSKQLDYINTNVFEITKALNNVERAIDALNHTYQSRIR
jgi:prefoldin subunit 5